MKYNGHDIYGNNLLKGHCEVHPHVAHDYPCPECRNEKDDRENQYRAYKKHCEQEYAKYIQEQSPDYEEE